MMLSNADIDELFASQDLSTRQTVTGGSDVEAHVALFPLNHPDAIRANIAQSTILAAAVIAATWSMVATISRMGI